MDSGRLVAVATRRSTSPSGSELLIVDGDRSVHHVLATAFEPEPWGCVTSGREALSLLVERRSGVLVIDIELPDMDGADVVRRARQVAPEMVIVVVTGRVAESDHLRGLTAGADAYLTEPIDADGVLATVAQLQSLDEDGRRRRRDRELAITRLLLRLDQNDTGVRAPQALYEPRVPSGGGLRPRSRAVDHASP